MQLRCWHWWPSRADEYLKGRTGIQNLQSPSEQPAHGRGGLSFELGALHHVHCRSHCAHHSSSLGLKLVCFPNESRWLQIVQYHCQYPFSQNDHACIVPGLPWTTTQCTNGNNSTCDTCHAKASFLVRWIRLRAEITPLALSSIAHGSCNN
jgi:hypothetical protein